MEVKFGVQPRTRIRIQRRDYKTMRMDKPGPTLFCDSGILWVTQSGDRHDYVLWPGQKLVVTKKGKILIEAMRDADFHIA
jgi:hypothetical protein